MLRHYLFPKLASNDTNMAFQRNGAFMYYMIRFIPYSDKNLPKHVEGGGGPIPWPAWSPDLTHDVFLWAQLKHEVFSVLSQNIPDLKINICQPSTSITEETLLKAFKNYEKHVCL